MARNPGLVYQVDQALNAKINFDGFDKHENKQEAIDNFILSRTTLKTYKTECCRFVKWVKAEHSEVHTLAECRSYAEDYLSRTKENGEPYSAWSLKTQRAAIAKLYGEKCRDICANLPERRRADITRSRNDSTMDGHYSAKLHPDVELLGKAAGLRRADFSRLYRESIYFRSDGELVAFIDKGKGGKSREAVIDPAYREEVLSLARRTPDKQRLVPKGEIPQNLDQHALRRIYAASMMKYYSRPLNEIPREDRYYCRRDKSGEVYDRKAMALVSRSLGHCHKDKNGDWVDRVNVIAGHYV